MDEDTRHQLTFYFNSDLAGLTFFQLWHYDALINQHISECIEIRGFIHREEALRRRNGHSPGE